jgi:hypothetical protein
MKKCFVKIVAAFVVCLGVTLNPSSSLGQSIIARHHGLRSGSLGLFHIPSSTRETTAGPPSSRQYTFTIIEFPGQLYTNGNGANSVGQIVGVYGPAVSQGGYGDGFLLTTRRHKKSISETFSTIDFPKAISQWRRHQGRAGAVAPCKQQDHDGCLHSSTLTDQARSARPGGQHDPA